MSVQNANSVAITGGTLANVALSGNISQTGGNFSISSTSGIALNVAGLANAYSAWIQGGAAASHGLMIRAGTGSAGENALIVQNSAGSATGLIVNGALTVSIPTRLVIPVGANFWA